MDDDEAAADNCCVCCISRGVTEVAAVCVSKTTTPVASILGGVALDPGIVDVVGLFGRDSETAVSATSVGATTERPEATLQTLFNCEKAIGQQAQITS